MALLAVALASGSAVAQSRTERYPVKPIRLIVPLAPGGGADFVARTLAQHLSEALGVTVVVDNRPGGGGTIGAETVVRASPDGYTLAVITSSYASNAALFKLPYDPYSDITPIALIGESGFMVTLHPGVAAKSIRELIALAKAKPGSLHYASTGPGSGTHLTMELFDLMAGTRMTHVPYKNTGGAFTDLFSGRVQLICGSLPSTVPHHKSGRLRGIAVTTAKRVSALPDIPTVGETIPGYEANTWYAMLGPRNLPNDIVTRLNAEIAKGLAGPAMRERMESEGLEPAGGPPEQLRRVLKRDVPKWMKVVKEAKVSVMQ